MLVVAALAALLLPMVASQSAGDPFTNRECAVTGTGSPKCGCNWKVDKSNLQCAGLAFAPKSAQGTAASCEQWCCQCSTCQ